MRDEQPRRYGSLFRLRRGKRVRRNGRGFFATKSPYEGGRYAFTRHKSEFLDERKLLGKHEFVHEYEHEFVRKRKHDFFGEYKLVHEYEHDFFDERKFVREHELLDEYEQ